MISAVHRLASYGTLAPGQPNHHELADLNGRWFKGTVRGRLLKIGWGANLGYLGLVLDADGGMINVHVFESADLPDHWSRLDEFEGAEYHRTIVDVETPDGIVEASIYTVEE